MRRKEPRNRNEAIILPLEKGKRDPDRAINLPSDAGPDKQRKGRDFWTEGAALGGVIAQLIKRVDRPRPMGQGSKHQRGVSG